MARFMITLVCTLLGAFVGWLCDHIWWGSFIGFVVGVALSIPNSGLVDGVGDALSSIDFTSGDGGGGWSGGDSGGGDGGGGSD